MRAVRRQNSSMPGTGIAAASNSHGASSRVVTLTECAGST